MSHQEPTIATILRQLADEYRGPVKEQQILDRVLELRPSNAKNPYTTIRERLRWDAIELGWLRLNRHELVPLRVVLAGLSFRCIPRQRDIAGGRLPLAYFQPFAGLRKYHAHLLDDQGEIYELLELNAPKSRGAPPVRQSLNFNLSAWFQRTGFVAGDSIIVTLDRSIAGLMRIEREPQAAFRAAEVASQDAELIEAIVERVGRTQATLNSCEEIVLPIFATAAWRESYPGTPWQLLAMRDGRIQIIDDVFVTQTRHTNARFPATNTVFVAEEISDFAQYNTGAAQNEIDALQNAIEALQTEIRRSRQQDAEAGIWSGEIRRSSNMSLFNRQVTLGDNSKFGDADDDDWDELDEDPILDLPPLDPNTRIPSLREAQSRMMKLLPAETVQRLQDASQDEAYVLIAAHLNTLLVRDPELFPKLDLSPISEGSAIPDPDALSWQQERDYWNNLGDDEDDEDDEDEDDEESLEDSLEMAELNYGFANSSDAIHKSQQLMHQFYDYLRETGISETTAEQRASYLMFYAMFLSDIYGRTLREGDYASLDECLFFYYPRHHPSPTPRNVREICVSLKQFYSFLKLRGDISDDRFAHAHWRRRNQAARVVELLAQIEVGTSNYERLFLRLFDPYLS